MCVCVCCVFCVVSFVCVAFSLRSYSPEARACNVSVSILTGERVDIREQQYVV